MTARLLRLQRLLLLVTAMAGGVIALSVVKIATDPTLDQLVDEAGTIFMAITAVGAYVALYYAYKAIDAQDQELRYHRQRMAERYARGDHVG